MIIRERYLKQIRPFYNQELIKVLIGIRRSGKSVILTQIIDELTKQAIDEEHIIYMNFEDFDYEDYANPKKLHNYVKEKIKDAQENFGEDIIESLSIIGRCRSKKSENYQSAQKLINARITNLESNLHIEIDMERIEDRSKALSYIGIEVADALKLIPAPQEDETENIVEEAPIEEAITTNAQTIREETPATQQQQDYIDQTRVEVKPSLWQRIKNSKFVRTISYILKIRVVLQVPALPEGKGEN